MTEDTDTDPRAIMASRIELVRPGEQAIADKIGLPAGSRAMFFQAAVPEGWKLISREGDGLLCEKTC